MVYMCADSGNLMAIAQQVIKQKQQQEEQHHQQHHHHQPPPLGSFSVAAWPNNAAHQPPNLGYGGLPGSGFSDPFQLPGSSDAAGEPGFPFPNLDHHSAEFRFSNLDGGVGEFDSDEWMD